MTISLRGYDAWATTPPDDREEPEHMDDSERRMKDLDTLLRECAPRELRLAELMVRNAIERERKEAEATLAELNRTRAERSDKGKPRKRAANDTTPADADPFEVSR